MLRDLECPTLQQRRHYSCLTMLYKIYNRLVDTDFTSQFTLTQSSTRGHASYNYSAAVLLTPSRSFLVLFGTGMHWWQIHYFFRPMTPSRTTSSLICHHSTSVFSLITFYPQETWLTQPLCVCLLQEVALSTEDEMINWHAKSFWAASLIEYLLGRCRTGTPGAKQKYGNTSL